MTCPEHSGKMIYLADLGNGDASVNEYWRAVKDDCSSFCLTEMQLDVSGTLVIDQERQLSIDMTHVNFFKKLP